MIRILLFGLLLTVSFLGYSQYNFDSKKAEKTYLKAKTYYDEADYENILDLKEDLETLFLWKGDSVTANVYAWLGEAYLYWEYDQAQSVDFFQKEYDLRKALDGAGGSLAPTIYNLAYLQDELGYYKESENLYKELLVIEERQYGSKSEEYFTSASSLLEHYLYVEEVEKGLEFAKKLKKLTKKNTLNEALVLKFTGDLYELSGSFNKAEKNLLEAISILDKIGMYPSIEYGAFLNSLAGLYVSMSKIPAAEELYNRAVGIFERLQGDNEEYILAINGNLGLLYSALGNYKKSEEIFVNNLAKDEEFYGKESYIYAIDAGNLANSYQYAGNYGKSEEYNKIAGEVYKEIVGENSIEYARVLQNLAYIYTKVAKVDEAIELGKRAVGIVKEVSEDDFQLSFATFNLADAYFAYGDLEKAETLHLEALSLVDQSVGTKHPNYARSTTKLAILNWRKKDNSKALSFYEDTFDNYFTQINTVFPVLSEEEKSKFYYNKLKPAFEQFNSFIVETSREEKELIGRMYNNQLATKGLILYATNKVRDAINKSGDSLIIQKYGTWIEQKEQLAKLYSAGDVPIDIRNRQIDSLNEASNEIEKELSIASAEFAATFSNKEYTWEDVRDKLKPGEAAVEIIRFRDFTPDSAGIFTDEVYYAALIVTPESKDYPELVLLRNGQKMETRFLSNYRNAIKYRVKENFSYNLFWKPIVNKLTGVKKVYFSPDGVYNQISIYTLRNPASNKFTIDEMEIQLVTNTKDLVAYEPKDLSNNPSYLFGYPNYNMGDMDSEEVGEDADNRSISRGGGGERGARGARGGAGDKEFEELSRSGSIPRGLRGNMLRYMRSNAMLSLLPGTKKEVELIDSLYAIKQKPVISYYSNEALEDSIKALKNPRTLHIATHGFFLESEANEGGQGDDYVANPLLRSGLILAGANSFIRDGRISSEIDYDQDGILTAFEAMNLNLDQTELVVLSACETGLGEVANGEGVYGLQRAFKIAGADAIIMSMWTVDDAATQELMTLFYEEWLGGQNKQTAFINAQKRLKDKWKDPYYWGAFVMVGN